jgi:hypothetical protein
MTLDDLISATGERFFTQLLIEAWPSIVAASEAAYFERMQIEENRIYEAQALLLADQNLHHFNLTSEGHRQDDQQETIRGTVLPISTIVGVESHLVRSGWARGDDARLMEDREYGATIVLNRDAGSLGAEISLPFGGDRRLGERYAPIARVFIERLTDKMGRA